MVAAGPRCHTSVVDTQLLFSCRQAWKGYSREQVLDPQAPQMAATLGFSPGQKRPHGSQNQGFRHHTMRSFPSCSGGIQGTSHPNADDAQSRHSGGFSRSLCSGIADPARAASSEMKLREYEELGRD